MRSGGVVFATSALPTFKESDFDGGGPPDELGAIGFQVGLNGANSSEADRHPFLILEESVVGKRFANFHDLDVLILHFPQLPLGQRQGRVFFWLYLHSVITCFKVVENVRTIFNPQPEEMHSN
jgi:hypothetical protein